MDITFDQRPCRYDAEGRPTVTLSVSGELRVGIGVEGGGGRGSAEGSLDAYAGKALTYEINTDPQTAEDIRNGAAPPNPVDPTSIPPGSSIILNEDTYAGLDLSASYAAMRASLGYQDGRRVSSAVERVDEDTVRVTVGDADLVAESVSLGIGTEHVNVGLSAMEELTAGQTRQVDIDISTPAGREAYAQFVATGELPAEGSAGVSDASASEVINYSSSTSLGGRLGPFQATVFASDGAGQIIDTTNPDGSHTSTQFAREGGVSFTRTVQTDAAGDRVGAEEYVLRMQDVSGYSIDSFNQLRGAELDPDIPTQDVTMSFTGEEFEEMQRRALDQVVAANPDLSREDIVRMLEEDGAYAALLGDTTTRAIAAASEPAEVAQALLLVARGDGTALAEYLLKFEMASRTGDPDEDEDNLLIPPLGLGGPSC